jgi:hypothetical protein
MTKFKTNKFYFIKLASMFLRQPRNLLGKYNWQIHVEKKMSYMNNRSEQYLADT